jgi:hypothetical protein
MWAQEVASVATEFLTNLETYVATREGYESIAELRLAANRRSLGQLLLGATHMQSDNLGLTFVER